MRAWTVDADDIRVAEDLDDALVRKKEGRNRICGSGSTASNSDRDTMKAVAVTLALALAGCAHASGLRYIFAPCNPGFHDSVRACLYEAGIGGPVAAYDFYADSGIIEKHWKRQYESCMFRRGYQQLEGPITWHPKERFNGAKGWPWPQDPPKSAWVWVRTAGPGDRHYYDAVCEP